MAQDYTSIHLLAGGLGGTAGAVITCPLEVVKTRLQSSLNTFATASPALVQHKVAYIPSTLSSATFSTCTSTCTTTVTSSKPVTTPRTSVSLTMCLKHIIKNEGAQGLFKGLGPNLIGVAPSRAVYFFSYAQAKKHLNKVLPEETPIVHVCSAACAGFTASTLTNPIWFVKTRLQLDLKRNSKLTARDCIRQIYQKHGIQGFYKGITASYYGITETAIHFVIYEAIKAYLREMKGQEIYEADRSAIDFVQFMMAGATSKTIATCVAYPHEVARTRLRQEGTRYNTFWQTLRLVFKEEGPRGLYRGLCTQLVRQIPNTAIMMSTYEAVVYLCMKYWHHS